MKSRIHLQTSNREPFKFGNGDVISFQAFLVISMWLLIHAEIKVDLF